MTTPSTPILVWLGTSVASLALIANLALVLASRTSRIDPNYLGRLLMVLSVLLGVVEIALLLLAIALFWS